MSNTVTGYIGKSGLVAFFLFEDGSPDWIWTSQASDPTIVVNGGSPIALANRTAYAISAGFGPSYVSYPLATKIEPEDVVTFSASEGWVSFGASGTAPAATDEPMTNWSGVEMFPIVEEKTLKLGMNLYGDHPTQTVHILRNLFGATNGGTGVVSTDDNFRPTAISGNAVYNTNNQWTGNGINDRGTGGVEGVYTDTWKDYSVGRNKLSWIEVHDPAQTIIAEVGEKATLETTADYTKYRRQFSLTFNPTRTTDYLGFNTLFDSIDVKDIEVVGPWNDPDSTEYLDSYVKSMLSGITRIRHSQNSEAINSNAATYDDCRQPDDLSTGLYKYREAQLIKVEPIGACTMTWDGDDFAVVDKTTIGGAGTDPTSVVGIKCTTSAPHGFSTMQGVDFNLIYNLDYAKPTDPTDHCGVQVDGIDGPIWMPFHQEVGVPIWVTGPTTFICYPSFVVATAGVADPIGTQMFDGSVSTLRIYVRRIGMMAYEKQIQICSETDPPSEAHLNFSECMTTQGMTDAATSVLATYLALPEERRPPHIDVEDADEHWNPGYAVYSRMQALSRIVGHNVTPGSVRECFTYAAGRLTSAFQAVFEDAGVHGVVRRGLWFQRSGDVELQYAQANGLTFEVGGCSSYFFSTFPGNSWLPYNTSVDQLHDLWQWMLQYVFVGQSTAMLANIAAYMPGMALVAYEGGEDQYSPGPFDAAEMTDWYYSARNYETVQATLINAQNAEFEAVNLYNLQNGVRTDTGTMWQHLMNNAQVPGLGVSPPNLTTATAGADDNIDLFNQNPKLLALRDWLGSTPTPTPTPTPSPTLKLLLDPWHTVGTT